MSALLGLAFALFAAIGVYHTLRATGRSIARGWKRLLGRLAALRAKIGRKDDPSLASEIRALRAEVAELRGMAQPAAQPAAQVEAPWYRAQPEKQEISEADLEEFMRQAVNRSRPAA